ncbi:MAG TPA: hypothetical protein PKM72_02760 [Nitrospirales bacterium]|nr:hypothetical protein [Nitrospirales bacterium]
MGTILAGQLMTMRMSLLLVGLMLGKNVFAKPNVAAVGQFKEMNRSDLI